MKKKGDQCCCLCRVRELFTVIAENLSCLSLIRLGITNKYHHSLVSDMMAREEYWMKRIRLGVEYAYGDEPLNPKSDPKATFRWTFFKAKDYKDWVRQITIPLKAEEARDDSGQTHIGTILYVIVDDYSEQHSLWAQARFYMTRYLDGLNFMHLIKTHVMIKHHIDYKPKKGLDPVCSTKHSSQAVNRCLIV
jgi:hypothetical protein